MLFGYELELFCINKRKEIVVPWKPDFHSYRDGDGILLEARGEPLNHPKLAEVSLKLAIEKLSKIARTAKRGLLLAAEGDVDPRSLHYARAHKKFYGQAVQATFERYRNPVVLKHNDPGHYKAGLHIHFSQPDPVTAGKYIPFDILYPIRLLDQEFADVIAAAGRHPGAYRMKVPYGFEYRSLPATVSLKQVTKVLLKMLEPREFEMYPDSKIPDNEDDL